MPGTARPARPGPSERAPRSDWTLARRRMLERLVADGIDDARVLAAFEAVPRERLVPEALRPQAYRDTALPIGEGQTISAPGIVAAMTSALALEGNETVLEDLDCNDILDPHRHTHQLVHDADALALLARADKLKRGVLPPRDGAK